MRRKIIKPSGNVVGPSDGIDGDVGNSDGGHSGGDSTIATSADSSDTVIDPATVASPGTGDTGEPRTKRKYTRRTGRTDDSAQASLGVNAIETILHSIHLGISALASAPELQLDPIESSALAKGIAAVGRHYPAFQMSEKAADWGNLIVLAFGIYGPRMLAIQSRRASTPRPPRATAQSHQPSPVNNPRSNGVSRVVIPGTDQTVEIPEGGWPATAFQ